MVKFALLMYMCEFRLRVFVVFVIGNSESNHLGAQGTFKEFGIRAKGGLRVKGSRAKE